MSDKKNKPELLHRVVAFARPDSKPPVFIVKIERELPSGVVVESSHINHLN